MWFVDTNVFMYAVGAEHPHKAPSIRFFQGAADGAHEIATSAEVLQEILHRFWAIQRIKDGYRLCEYVHSVCDLILPVLPEDIYDAIAMAKPLRSISPRDAIHVATMKRHGISTIVSFDRHFDSFKNIRRFIPE